MSATNATFSMDSNKTNVLTWGILKASSMEAAIHLCPDLFTNSEIYKNTKIEDIWSVFNITQKLTKVHSEEILNVECLEYSLPSWTRSMLANDQAVKWAKAKVCVYADSILCVGQVKKFQEQQKDGKDKIEDLKMYPSYQDASGLDGEPIEFEWKYFRGFRTLSTNIKPEDFKDRIIFMSMFNDIVWKKNDFECRRSQELRHEVLTKTSDDSGSRIGRKVVWRFPWSKRTVELHRQQDGTAIQRDWSSCLQKYQCFESWNLEAKEKQVYAWHKKKKDESLFLWTKILTWWSQKKWNCWCLFRPRRVETGCKEAHWASKSWKRRYSLHNFVNKLSSNILWLPGIILKFDQMQTTGGEVEFSILSENQSVVSCSRRHHHWTSFGSSRCKNSWQLLHRSCNSINCKPRQNTQLTLFFREEERFVNEIHEHKQVLRSSNELLANIHESGRNEEGQVTRSHKETWAAPSTKEISAGPVILTPRASLFTKRNHAHIAGLEYCIKRGWITCQHAQAKAHNIWSATSNQCGDTSAHILCLELG